MVASEEDLLARILQDFGILSRTDPSVDSSIRVAKQDLLDALVCFLRGLAPIKAAAVLIVDDAQNLPREALAEIASLAELENNRKPLLQIVLVGLPALREMLRAPEGSALDQGVALRCELDPPGDIVENAPSWLRRRVPPLAAIGVALLASVLAVGVTAILVLRSG